MICALRGRDDGTQTGEASRGCDEGGGWGWSERRARRRLEWWEWCGRAPMTEEEGGVEGHASRRLVWDREVECGRAW